MIFRTKQHIIPLKYFIILLFPIILCCACNVQVEHNAIEPLISSISDDVIVPQNKRITISVSVVPVDSGEIFYKWYKAVDKLSKGIEIYNSNSNELEPDTNSVGSVYYYCEITNTLGSSRCKILSPRINVCVSEKINANIPVILKQPSDVDAVIPAVEYLTVSAYTSDSGNLSYQWYKISNDDTEDILLENATSSTYKVSAENITNENYYCIITNTIEDNGDGGIKSISVKTNVVRFNAIFLRDIVTAPVFIEQPKDIYISAYNQKTKISCLVANSVYDINYQWYKSSDGTTKTGVPIKGANKEEYEVPIINKKGCYYYYCVVTNRLPADSDIDIKSAAAISNIALVAYTGLDTLYLDLDSEVTSITKEDYVLGDLKLISQDFGNMTYTFKDIKEGVKGRGNSSWAFPKKGYNIKFSKKQSFFGHPKAKKWCIIANYSDKTLIRNKFASIIGKNIYDTEWEPDFDYVDVVINGDYMGNYIFCEKITISDGRVEIQDISDVEEKIAESKEDKIEDVNKDGIKDLNDGGFIIEIEGSESRAIENDFYFLSNQGKYFCLQDPDEVSIEIQNHVQQIIQNAEDVLYSDSYNDIENGWRKYIDENSVIDWYLINEFAKNRDACNWFSSVYMYYNPVDEKLHLGPNWDFDIGFGNDGEDGAKSYENPNWWLAKNNALWINRMFQDDLFVNNVKARWNEKKTELAMYIKTEVYNQAEYLDISQYCNFLRWEILGTYVWPNPSGWEERLTYEDEINYMINWMTMRYNWIDSSINAY